MRITPLSYLSFLFLIFALSCSSEDPPPPPPETESENLNEMLQFAPISWINLNESEIDTLLIPDSKIHVNRYSDDLTVESGRPTQVKVFGDYLVTLEYLSPYVIVLDKEGKPKKKIEGDFQRPASIMSDNNALYIYDDDLKEIHEYNSEFEFQSSFPFEHPYYTQGSVLMNKSHFAYQNEEASGFRVSDTERKLLTVASKEIPDSTLFEALPRIVPAGKHPGGFNNLLFSMNSKNEIAAAYPALPFLFIYRDFEHNHNIILQSDQFKTIENPSLNPFEPEFGEAVRVNSLMNYIYLREDGDILLFSFQLLHHLKNSSDDGYSHHRSYALFRGDTGEQIESVSSMDEIPDEPNRIFTTGMRTLFELNLPD